jgi:hypothetical protein
LIDFLHADERNPRRCFVFYARKNNVAGRFRRGHACQAISQELTEDATMRLVKQASKQKRRTKTGIVKELGAKALGAAGLSFSLVGGASASAVPAADVPQFDSSSPNQRFVLGEEEMADVSLATFYVFDREHAGSGVQLARGGCGGGGCRGGGGGCGGCRGGGGGGCRGGGFGCRGCGGCGVGFGGCGYGWYGGYGVYGPYVPYGGGCCGSWGACRLC